MMKVEEGVQARELDSLPLPLTGASHRAAVLLHRDTKVVACPTSIQRGAEERSRGAVWTNPRPPPPPPLPLPLTPPPAAVVRTPRASSLFPNAQQ